MQRMLKVGLAALLVAAASCASGETEGQKSIGELTKSINKFADSIRRGRTEIETTLSEYDQIINNKDGELDKHFKAFNLGIDKIEKRREEISKAYDNVKASAEPFFARWQADNEKFSSEDMKKTANDRLEKTKERFGQIEKAGQDAKAAYGPLMADLKDQRLFFSNDLNAESAATQKDAAKRIQKNANDLFKLMDGVLDFTERYNKAVAMRTEPKESAS